MARELSEGLKKKQEMQKQKTLDELKNAIDTLRQIGYENISISNLVAETNLARSTLSKPHVQELLKREKIGKYRDVKTIITDNQSKNDKQSRDELEKRLNNALIKIQKLELELASTNGKLKEEKLISLQKNLDNKDLASKFQAMYEKVIAMGIEVIL